jgi:hypothetical protein
MVSKQWWVDCFPFPFLQFVFGQAIGIEEIKIEHVGLLPLHVQQMVGTNH